MSDPIPTATAYVPDEHERAILDLVAHRLLGELQAQPDYLLRQPGGGLHGAHHLIAAWFQDSEQNLTLRWMRGDAPAVWLTPHIPRARFSAEDEPGPAASFRTHRWYCQNIYAATTVAAEYLPRHPHDRLTLQVHVAGVLYEPEAPT